MNNKLRFYWVPTLKGGHFASRRGTSWRDATTTKLTMARKFDGVFDCQIWCAEANDQFDTDYEAVKYCAITQSALKGEKEG